MNHFWTIISHYWWVNKNYESLVCSIYGLVVTFLNAFDADILFETELMFLLNWSRLLNFFIVLFQRFLFEGGNKIMGKDNCSLYHPNCHRYRLTEPIFQAKQKSSNSYFYFFSRNVWYFDHFEKAYRKWSLDFIWAKLIQN
jgi:hypothetical protein